MSFFTPVGFLEIIESSFVENLILISLESFVIIIGLNNAIVGLLLISGFATRRVVIWAIIWFVGIMIIVGKPFDIYRTYRNLIYVNCFTDRS